MRKLLPLVILFLVSSLYAETFSRLEIESVKYEPEIIRTGDSVFCRIKLSGKKMTPSDAQNIRAEKHISFEVTDIKLNISSNELLIWFIPFNPLEKYLPSVKGEDFVIDKIPVKITGYAEPGDTVPEPPGAVLLPGTRLFFGFVFFLALLLFFLIYWFFRFFYKPFKEGIFGRLREMEIKKILREIRSLKKDTSEEIDKQLFSRLSRLFREYLEKRLETPFMPLTSGEITDKLVSEGIISERAADHLGNALFCSDRIRFGGKNNSLGSCFSDIAEAVESTADAVEKMTENRAKETARAGKRKRGEVNAV